MNHKCGTISDGTRDFHCDNNAQYWILAASGRKYYYCREHINKANDTNHIGNLNPINKQKNLIPKFEQKGELTASQIKKAIASIASLILPQFIYLSNSERTQEIDKETTRKTIRQYLHKNDKFFPDLRQDIKQYEEWVIEEIEEQLKQGKPKTSFYNEILPSERNFIVEERESIPYSTETWGETSVR